MNNYVVATIKPWNIEAYQNHVASMPGNWFLINDKDDLTKEALEKINPRYIFFPHWSWIVPQELLDNYDCVCFHMTDVPYGRGGSPLQNLIVLGHKETKLTALKMVKELDAGPVYGKIDLSLEGRAQDIFQRMSILVWDLIKRIVKEEPTPVEQKGEATVFQRRTEDQSELPPTDSLVKLYDHIRMLDAESYPLAFIEHGDFKIEFTDAVLDGDDLDCKVTIRKVKK